MTKRSKGGERAVLIDVDLTEANLRGASLIGANLTGADLKYANLIGANLKDVNLISVNLRCADLIGANLTNVKYDESTQFFTTQCPEEGEFIAYKKCRNDLIVELLIPADALRSSATTRKCRCSKAIVLEITDANDNKFEEAVSKYNSNFIYRVGEMVSVDNFDMDRWNECAPGIHFFMTKQEAINY